MQPLSICDKLKKMLFTSGAMVGVVGSVERLVATTLGLIPREAASPE